MPMLNWARSRPARKSAFASDQKFSSTLTPWINLLPYSDLILKILVEYGERDLTLTAFICARVCSRLGWRLEQPQSGTNHDTLRRSGGPCLSDRPEVIERRWHGARKDCIAGILPPRSRGFSGSPLRPDRCALGHRDDRRLLSQQCSWRQDRRGDAAESRWQDSPCMGQLRPVAWPF